MTAKTNFSFELYYAEQSAGTQAERDKVMHSLGESLQTAWRTADSAAIVVVSDSHKGSGNRIVEITTTLQDAQVADTLKQFCDANGLSASALE